MSHILAIDQGTTSGRALVFDEAFNCQGIGQLEFPQHFPASGWVEHDPEDIWAATVATARTAIAKAGLAPSAIAAIGLTNQRETCLLWDRRTGKPLHRAIVWQDRRTADTCANLKADGVEPLISARTGLLLDPYFSATKIAWLLDHIEGARAAADAGHVAAGTIDTFLLWRLTGGKVHATDATNASRTLLFDIHKRNWDDELLRLFRVPRSILPDVRDCGADFGMTKHDLFGAAIAIRGVAGDQQAAAIGQACFNSGMMKSTYGTGCFALLNTGDTPVASKNRLLTTIAYQLDGKPTYALEGSIFVAGAAVQWLRDGLHVIKSAAETGPLADTADRNQSVYLVPAFVGLGAPYWSTHARGALFGLSRATGPAELARAALEAVCFQTRDLLEAMRADWPSTEQADASPATPSTVLRVDGGMVASDWTMQFLADILDAPIDRPAVLETTALGAAWLAGRTAGVWPDQQGFAEHWRRDRRFVPGMAGVEREARYAGWKKAVAAVIGYAGEN